MDLSENPQIPTISCDVEITDKRRMLKFNDAMNLTGFGTFSVLMSLLCGFIILGIMLEMVAFSYILPAAQCDLGLSLGQKGWVGALPFIGIMLTSQMWGYLADTRGRKKILMIAMPVSCTCSIISGFCPNLVTFVIMRLLGAAFLSGASTVAFSYYGEFIPKKYADSMISVMSSVQIFAAALSTLIAWGILSLDFNVTIPVIGIDFRPWRLMVICYALPFVIVTLLFIKAPESPKFLMSTERNEETLAMLKLIFRLNTKKDESEFKVDGLILDDTDKIGSKNLSIWKSIKEQTVPLFKPPLLKDMVMLSALAFGIFSCASSFYLWLPDTVDRFYVGLDEGDSEDKLLCEVLQVRSDLNDKKNSTETDKCKDEMKVSTYPMMMYIVVIVGCSNVLLAYVLRYTKKKIALMALLASIAASILVSNWIHNIWVAWVLFNTNQIIGIIYGIITAYAIEMFPTNYRY